MKQLKNKMRTLWYNGNFYLSKDNFAQSIITENNKIVDIGTSKELLLKKYDFKYDLKKATAIPGLNDTHLHFLLSANALETLDLTNISSIEELINQFKKFLKNNKYKKNQILYSEGWNDLKFSEKRILTRHDLDKISKTNPIFFARIDRHLSCANTAGLKLINAFIKNFKSPYGGELELDNSGMPNGIIKENAQILFKEKLKPNSSSQNIKLLKKYMKLANSYGLTSAHTCDLIDHNSLDTWRQFEALDLKKELTIKFYHQCWMHNAKQMNQFLNKIKKFRHQSRFNKIGSLKLFADGSLGAKTAALSKSYITDSNNFGLLTYNDKELLNIFKTLKNKKMQFVIHAIGDAAIWQIIKTYAKLGEPNNQLRNAIIHLQITSKNLIKAFVKSKLLAFVQPIFLDDDLDILFNRVDKEIANSSYAFKTLIKNNVHVSLGTDAPVCSFNPWLNIYCALNRTKLNGEPKSGFNKEEALSIYEAIDAYSYEGAYASFEEKYKGRIAKNYFADFVVLNQNIFKITNLEKIKKTYAELTVVDGKVIYQRSLKYKKVKSK